MENNGRSPLDLKVKNTEKNMNQGRRGNVSYPGSDLVKTTGLPYRVRNNRDKDDENKESGKEIQDNAR